MQKTVSHKVFSTALALLVFLSTFSFKMETHFCGSKIVDVAVFSKVKSCCDLSINTADEHQFTKKSCCNNKVIFVDGLKQFKVVPLSVELPVENVFIVPQLFNAKSVVNRSSVEGCLYNYVPPNREFNFQIQHQVFLI